MTENNTKLIEGGYSAPLSGDPQRGQIDPTKGIEVYKWHNTNLDKRFQEYDKNLVEEVWRGEMLGRPAAMCIAFFDGGCGLVGGSDG